MRHLAALAALLLAAPAAGQDRPAWAGVWQGTISRLPVRLCIDARDGAARGSYYYLSELEPIALGEDDGEGGWIERAPGSDETALWHFTEQTGSRLRGTWIGPRRTFPFDLRPVAWTESEWGGPCASDAYLSPRVVAGLVRSDAAELHGWRYTTRAYTPAAHFAPEVAIDSFVVPLEQPGDAAINAALAAVLPQGTVADPFVQCLAGSIASLGYDGDYALFLQPVVVTPAFLVALESSSMFCGGAHPGHSYRYRTFDRVSGAELDLFDWLGDAAVERHPDGAAGTGYATVRPALQALIVARAPLADLAASADAEDASYPDECLELARAEDLWTLGLSRRGMLFVPSMPHVATPCVASFTVPWEQLERFLTDAGWAASATLAGG